VPHCLVIGLARLALEQVEPRPDPLAGGVRAERTNSNTVPGRHEPGHARAGGARIGTHKNRRCACVRSLIAVIRAAPVNDRSGFSTYT